MADPAALHQGIDPAAAVAAALELHRPVCRYKASFRDETTYPTAQRAYQVNCADPMRGYESIALSGPDDATFVEVCAECSRIDYGELDEDDAVHGDVLGTDACTWPCTTYAALAGAGR
ncbi:hypothetical protein GCM10027449_26460 [Sinomonas notoginsengisoli]|uniref:hypothetical protein n=1 Tax=Sinomonas notoginsengisoli TaxID=1457311 RepID=UPI001F36FB80|nr:hypothetical protein [Sinomonas notoginsengisoli]